MQGKRRIGKTSILKQLQYKLAYSKIDEDHVFYPVFFDLQNINQQEFFSRLMRKIVDELNLVDEIELPSISEKYSSYDFTKQIRIIFNLLKSKIPDKKASIVLLIDEMQKVNTFEPIFLEQLRKILDEEYIKLVMTGSRKLKEHRGATSPFNLHNSEIINTLIRDEAIELITHPIKDIYNFSEKDIPKILKASKLEPLIIQKICHEVINLLFAKEELTSSLIDSNLVDQAIEKTIKIKDHD